MSDTPSSTPLPTLLASLPPPLLTALPTLAIPLAVLSRAVQILAWRSPHWTEPWLALVTWWTLCYLGPAIIRYMLPAAILLFLVLPAPKTKQPPANAALASSLESISTLAELLPTIPTRPSQPISPKALLRTLGILYVPYLILTYFARLRLVPAVVGTSVLLSRAPWLRVLARTLSRSAHARRAYYRAREYLTGMPSPASNVSSSAMQSVEAEAGSHPGSEAFFEFTLLENQRWWMGLDWTSALLPSERPTWCTPPPPGASNTFAPTDPPSAFHLPEPMAMIVNSERREAKWEWVEREWRVVIRTANTGAAKRKVMPLPQPDGKPGKLDPGQLESVSAEQSDDGGDGAIKSPRDSSPHNMDGVGDPLTDADGWVYGDNKWEKANEKGGIGKYTRYRRWTRIAVVREIVTPLKPEDLATERERLETAARSRTSTSTERKLSPARPPEMGHKRSGSGSPADGLRQRLRAAVSGAS